MRIIDYDDELHLPGNHNPFGNMKPLPDIRVLLIAVHKVIGN